MMKTEEDTTEIGQLRALMQGLQPGVIEQAAENAAPLIAKLSGVMALVQPFLPLLRSTILAPRRRAAADAPVQAVARVPAPRAEEALPERRWRRPTWTQRHQGALLGTGLALVLGGAGYLALQGRRSRRPAKS